MSGLIAIAFGLFFFLALKNVVEFLNAELESQDRRFKECKQHIWPPEGPIICQRCGKNPKNDVSSKSDYEIGE